MSASPPFYLDWQFWAFGTAALALVLSQMPPVYLLIRRGKLSCETIDQILVNHSVGTPSGQWHVLLENIGGRPLRVKSIDITFHRGNAETFALPVRSYLQFPNSPDGVMFTPFSLAAGQSWGHVINFFMPLARDEEKQLRAMQAVVRNDIVAMKAMPENKDKWCESSEKEAVAGLVKFMQDRFKWAHGEYTVELKVRLERATDLVKRYTLILYESDSRELWSHSERYKYGDGVWFNSEEVRGLLLPIRQQSAAPDA